ncbi:MAG: TIGR01458 family HAD-type hydrolase [Methanomicrobiales archaeon]|nr:TIGR01458 family HAD-type hydrolase [Methanomicrobiales archaeon]
MPEAFLIDLDGVMYVGDTPVPGARDAVKFLEDQGHPFRFVSNTTRKSRHTVAGRLRSMGFSIPEEHIFTPAAAAVSYLSENRRKSAFLLTTDEVAREIVAASGIVHHPATAETVVIGDAGDRFTYESLNEAFRLLLEGAELVALERDRYWMGTDGMMLSAGPFVAALEYAGGKEALVMGKPSPAFFLRALASMGAEPGTAAMIGDDVVTDIGGAMSCGLSGILVKTGKFREETLARASHPPSAVLPSLADLPAYLRSLRL